MMRNTFRKVMGAVILLAFGVGIYAYIRQTRGNAFVGSALGFGLKVLLFLALVLGVVYMIDRRVNRRER